MTLANPSFGLGPIGQIAVTVGDLDRAVAFYRDKLGINFLFQFPGLAFFDCGGVRLMLSLPEKDSPIASGSAMYFKVEDLTVAHETLASRGVTFESPPHLIAKMPDHDLWMAFFRDPDGHLVGLMCEVRPPAS